MADVDELKVLIDSNQNYNEEEHLRHDTDLGTEITMRIAGDDAVSNEVAGVRNLAHLNSSSLSKEAIQRVEGDLLSDNNYADLLRQFNAEWGDINADISNLAIETRNSLSAYDTRLVTLGMHIEIVESDMRDLVAITDTKLQGNIDLLDNRVKKYEQLLSDITIDSTQITIDNGEINRGAWTILSQAREWDLEILASMKGYQESTTEELNQALEDMQNGLPVTEDIINQAMEELSKHPLIIELDEKLTSSIGDIDDVHKELLEEITNRQNEILTQAQATADELTKYNKELADSISKEASERITSLQREAAIRQEELELEASERSAEIDAKLKDITGGLEVDLTEVNKRLDDANAYAEQIKDDLSAEEKERIKEIERLDNGYTYLQQDIISGDMAIISQLDNYKTSNEFALANIQQSLNANVTATSSNTSKITALDGRLTTNEQLAASAVSKAETALSENQAQAVLINQVKASIEDINGALGDKADAQALQVLDTKVTTIDGKVTSQAVELSQLNSRVTTVEGGLATKVEASVLNNYYTKSQADSAIAGQITSFSSTLSNSGVNVFGYDMSTLASSVGTHGGSYYVVSRLVNEGYEGSDAYRIKTNNGTNTAYFYSGRGSWLAKSEPNQEYLVSIYVKSPLDKPVRIKQLGINASGASFLYPAYKDFDIVANEWTRISIRYKAKASDEYIGWAIQHNQDSAPVSDDNYVLVSRPMAERAYGVSEVPSNWVEGGGISKEVSANASAIIATNAEVTRVNGIVTSQSSTIATLTNRITTAEKGILTKADAAAVSSLSSKVDNIDGKVTSQGTSIEKLTNDLTVTNAEVNKKATSESVTALDSKVTQQGDTITSQGSSITKLTNDLNLTNAAVSKKAESSALSALDTKVTSIDGKVTSQGTQITELSNSLEAVKDDMKGMATSSALQNLDSKVTQQGKDIAANTSSITSLSGRVSIAEGDINKKADAAALATLNTKVTSIDGKVSTNSGSITTLQNRVTEAEGDISKKADAAAVTALTTRVTETEKGISSASDQIVSLNNSYSSGVNVNSINATVTGLVTQITTGAVATQSEPTATAGQVLKLGSGSTSGVVNADCVWMHSPNFMPIDPNRLYRVKARFRVISGTSGIVYVGLACKSVDMRNYVTTTGTLSDTMGSSNYLINYRPPLGVWIEHEFFVKGTSTGSASGAGTLTDPRKFQVNAAYFSPMLIANYGTSDAAITEYDYVTVEFADEYPLIDAQASAIQTLGSKVEEIDGVVTSTSSAVTQLSNTLNTLESGLSDKADISALNSLSGKVTNNENKIEAHTTQLTQLTAKLESTGTNVSLTGTSSSISTDSNIISVPSLLSIIDEAGSASGKVIKAGGSASGGDYVTLLTAGMMLIDPTKLYRLKWRYKRVSGDGGIYISTQTPNATKTASVQSSNVIKGINAISNEMYAVSNAKPPLGVWQEGEYYYKGKSLAGSAGAGTVANPRKFPDLAAYVRLAVLFNYYNVPSEQHIDYIILEEADEKLVETALSDAITSLTSDVSKIDGTVTAQGKQITTLNSTVSTLGDRINTKADASALNALTVRVTSAEGVNTSQGTLITNLQNSLTTTNNNVAKKADSSALASLDSTVTGIDGRLTSTSTDLVALRGEIGAGNLVTPFKDVSYTGRNYLQVSVPLRESFTTALNEVYTIRAMVSLEHTGALSDSQGIGLYLSTGVRFSSLALIKQGNKQVVEGTVKIVSGSANRFVNSLNLYMLTEGTATSTTKTTLHWAEIYRGDQSISDRATVAAVNSLEATVTQQGTDITTLTNQTITLTGRVTSAEGKITTNTNAISTLNTKIIAIDGKITSQATSIIKINAELNSKASYIIATNRNGGAPAGGLSRGIYDSQKALVLGLYRGLNLVTWGANGALGTYTNFDTYTTPSLVANLAAAINALAANTYFSVIAADNIGTLAPSNAALIAAVTDNGGSAEYVAKWTTNVLPIFTSKKGQAPGTGIQHIFDSPVTGDGIQYVLEFIGGVPVGLAGAPTIDTAQFAKATALQTLDTKVTSIDGKVNTTAGSLLQLETKVGANTSAIAVQGSSINGIQAEYTIKLDVNGLVSGIGLINKGGSTAIGMNADIFYIGKPAGGKKPFMVLTSAQTINGVTYPAGTWIDVALIANATIGTAKIADLAVTDAKIANLAVTNAKISNLAVTGAKIADATIGTAKIANLAVTGAKIANATINTAQIADAAITTAKIGNLQVDTLKIKDNAVTIPTGLNIDNYRLDCYQYVVGMSANPISPPPTDPEVNLQYFLRNSPIIFNATIPRQGGKLRIDVSMQLTTTQANGGLFFVLKQGSGDSNTSEEIRRSARLVAVIYRNDVEIHRAYFSPTSFPGSMVGYIGNMTFLTMEESSQTGNFRYSMKIGAQYSGSRTDINVTPVGTQTGQYFMDISGISVSFLEMKK